MHMKYQKKLWCYLRSLKGIFIENDSLGLFYLTALPDYAHEILP